MMKASYRSAKALRPGTNRGSCMRGGPFDDKLLPGTALHLDGTLPKLNRRRPREDCRVDLQLRGRRALVTGSTAGIGFVIAEALAREGAAVIVNGRSQARVEEA